MKRGAFTLAEVLVTLGVIGIVSALTMPSLVQNYQKKSYTTQLRKVTSEFQQVTLNFINSKNALNLKEAGIKNGSALESMIEANMKTEKTCSNRGDGCFASSYKNLNGYSATLLIGYKSFLLPSGAAISGNFRGGTGLFAIDVNGKKAPNTIGRDLFVATIDNNGRLTSSTISDSGSDSYSHSHPNCSNWGHTHPNYDYYHCDSYSHSHSHSSTPAEKCRNATFLSTFHDESDAGYCYNLLVEDDWEMKY